ncbi:hypothetical protein O1F49_002656 [Enterococcus hirae]|nr:hypothetical protein [Enterococcus hirae]
MKKTLKTTDAQRKAIKKYEQKNATEKQYRNKKYATKSFITKLATNEDIQLVKEWLKQREDQTNLN